MVHFRSQGHFISYPDHGMVLIGLSTVTALMPQSSKCTSLKMARYKSTKHDFSIVQTFQLGSIGMEGSSLDQIDHLSGQPISVERGDNQDDRRSRSSSNTKTLTPSNHPLRTNSHLKPQINNTTLSHVATPYETELHARVELPEREG